MAKSGSERQQRHREKMKKDKKLARLQVTVSLEAKANLDALVNYFSMTQRGVIERALLALDRDKVKEKELMEEEKSAERDNAEFRNHCLDAFLDDNVTL